MPNDESIYSLVFSSTASHYKSPSLTAVYTKWALIYGALLSGKIDGKGGGAQEDGKKDGGADVGGVLAGNNRLEKIILNLIRQNQVAKAVRLLQKKFEAARTPGAQKEVLDAGYIAKVELKVLGWIQDMLEIENTILIGDMPATGVDFSNTRHVLPYELYGDASLPLFDKEGRMIFTSNENKSTVFGMFMGDMQASDGISEQDLPYMREMFSEAFEADYDNFIAAYARFQNMPADEVRAPEKSLVQSSLSSLAAHGFDDVLSAQLHATAPPMAVANDDFPSDMDGTREEISLKESMACLVAAFRGRVVCDDHYTDADIARAFAAADDSTSFEGMDAQKVVSFVAEILDKASDESDPQELKDLAQELCEKIKNHSKARDILKCLSDRNKGAKGMSVRKSIKKASSFMLKEAAL